MVETSSFQYSPSVSGERSWGSTDVKELPGDIGIEVLEQLDLEVFREMFHGIKSESPKSERIHEPERPFFDLGADLLSAWQYLL